MGERETKESLSPAWLFFFFYPEAACVWVFPPMHITHRCRTGPRLIKGFSALPAEVPGGYLLGCFTSHCPGRGFETCPLIKERASPLSFVPSLLDYTALLEPCWLQVRATMKLHRFHFYGKGKVAARGRRASLPVWYHVYLQTRRNSGVHLFMRKP